MTPGATVGDARLENRSNLDVHPPGLDREVILLGAGGHGKVVLSTLLDNHSWKVKVYDDDAAKQGGLLLGVPVSGKISDLDDSTGRLSIVGLGDNSTRQKLVSRFPSAEWLTVVHRKAYVHPSATVGPGTVVVAGAVIQAGVKIGRHCIINTGAVVDYDCVIGDYCHLGPGSNLGAGTTLGDGVFIGIGSVVCPQSVIGAWTIVGAGASVVEPLPSGVVAFGMPARVQRTL